MAGIAEYGFIILGTALGLGIGWLLAKNRYSSDVIRAEAQVAAISLSKDSMLAEMQSVATNVARQNSEDFLRLAEERLGKVESESAKDHVARKKEVESLVTPIKEHLEKLEKATTEMELKREGAYQGLKRTADMLHQQTVDLRDTNVQLSTALRGSVKARGNWGQVALKNIAGSAMGAQEGGPTLINMAMTQKAIHNKMDENDSDKGIKLFGAKQQNPGINSLKNMDVDVKSKTKVASLEPNASLSGAQRPMIDKYSLVGAPPANAYASNLTSFNRIQSMSSKQAKLSAKAQ